MVIAREVHVFLEHDEQVRWCCPECSAECGLHDHQPERCWRHLDTCLYRTILHSRRCLCPEGDAASVGAAGAESCREGKAGALSAEWSLAWPERLDQTRYEGRTGEDRRV